MLNHVFRLKPPTIRHHNGGWYLSFEDHPTNWGRKYKSLQAVLSAAARKGAEEWMTRAHRIERPTPKLRKAA
jgi:hypothetical protein